ncbi:hypothetical protein J6590_009530 [Homalodisca vitripennis]|nr:hypothetical protein J6590_009530 [Homalodisca vitripennis]
MLKGHGPLRKHLMGVGLRQTDECRLCGEEEESAEHIWLDDPVILETRKRFLGAYLLSPKDIREQEPSNLIARGQTVLSCQEKKEIFRNFRSILDEPFDACFNSITSAWNTVICFPKGTSLVPGPYTQNSLALSPT